MIDLRPDILVVVRDILGRIVPGYEVRAFGSRQKWTAKDASDLDLAVVAPSRLPIKTMATLKEAFEDSILPMRVDVLDWQAISPEFRSVIEESFEVIQGAEASPLAPASSPAAAEPFATPLCESANDNIPKTRLDDLCTLIVDCPHSTPVWTNSGKIVLRSQNIRNGHLDISERSYTDSKHFADRIRRAQPKKNDLVITREAPMGEVCIIPDGLECCLGQRMVLLRPDDSLVDPLYLLFAIQSSEVQHQIQWSEGTGSTVSNLRIPHLEALKIPSPPLPIQKIIAHILGTLDDRIELCRRMNETLEALARALFKDWFIDFGPVRAKMEGCEPPGLSPDIAALFPSKLVSSDLGEIPEGWDVNPLSSFMELIGGGTPKTSEQKFWGGVIPWYSVVDAPSPENVFVISTQKSITQSGIENSSTRLIPVGATIISARGTVGKLAVVGTPMAMNQSCYGVVGSNGFTPFFVYYSLKNAIQNLQANTHGSVFDTITRSTFESVFASVPSIDLVRAFDSNVANSMTGILENLKKSETLSSLREALLPKLLSGEISTEELKDFKQSTESILR